MKSLLNNFFLNAIFLLIIILKVSSINAQTHCDESGVLSIVNTSVTIPSCYGGNDGTISVSVNGPVNVAYTYSLTGSINNPQFYTGSGNTYQFQDLEATGFYVLEVRVPIDPSDPNTKFYSCVQIASITSPEKMTVTGESTAPVCAGGTNGNISLNITNGNPPFQVVWSDGGTGVSRNDLGQGTYTAQVTDANGCTTSTGAFTLSDPPALSAAALVTDVKCNGGKDGAADISVSEGTAPYSYTSSAGSGNSLSNLTAGTYTVDVTDANSCTTSVSFSVAEPSPISSAVASTTLKCHGDTNGEITVQVTGGTPDYTITMENNNSTQSGSSVTFGGNGAGSGTLVIEDSKGCKANASYTVSGPPAVEFGLSMKQDDCGYGEGAIRSFSPATGGNGGPYTYTYSANGGPFTSFTPPHDFRAIDGIDTRGESVVVEITDKDGCKYSFGSTITDMPRAIPYIRIERNACIGNTTGKIIIDSVQMNASIPAYTFYLAPDDGNRNFTGTPGGGEKGQSAVFSDLSTGGYIMEIADGKPCGPYAISQFYLWDGTHYDLVTDTSHYTRNDGTGIDTVKAFSDHSSPYAVMQVIEPDPFHAETFVLVEEEKVLIYNITGGTPAYIDGQAAYQLAIDNIANLSYYTSQPAIVNGSAVNLFASLGPYTPGEHILYIVDSFGCIDSISITLPGKFFIPNLVTMNGDGKNDLFKIPSLPPFSEMKIYNRWGSLVFHNINYDNSFPDESVADGIYYYELLINSGKRYKGWVEVLR